MTTAPTVGVDNFTDKFAFFTVPSLFLGYDIFIPDTEIKITPILKVGLTTNPFIPRALVTDSDKYEKIDVRVENDFDDLKNMYSGLFFELSVAVAFKSIQWKK